MMEEIIKKNRRECDHSDCAAVMSFDQKKLTAKSIRTLCVRCGSYGDIIPQKIEWEKEDEDILKTAKENDLPAQFTKDIMEAMGEDKDKATLFVPEGRKMGDFVFDIHETTMIKEAIEKEDLIKLVLKHGYTIDELEFQKHPSCERLVRKSDGKTLIEWR